MPAEAPGASAGRAPNSVRMLAAHFDAAAGLSTGSGGTTSHAALQGLRVESQVILNNEGAEHRLASISQVLVGPCAAQSLPAVKHMQSSSIHFTVWSCDAFRR